MRLWRRRSTEDVSAEIEAHLAIEADRLARERGITETEALLEARRRFGNVGAVKERFYEARRGIWAEHLRRDVVRAVRSLGRSPAFTVVVLATLALGIGSVTTIFSVVNTIALRPLPYHDASRIFALTERRAGDDPDFYFSQMSGVAIAEIRRVSRSFERIAVSADWQGSLVTGDEPMNVVGQRVDSTVFGLLGASAERGRLFAPDEFAQEAPVALLSDALWRGHFNADEAVVGRVIRLGGRDRVVVGILPPDFRFPMGTDVWLPMLERRDSAYSVLGKLRRGVTLAKARSEMTAIGHGLAKADPTHFLATTQITVRDGMTDVSRTQTFLAALPFLVAAICVLLVACANIAGLMRVRAAARRREMAIRSSMGGSARRLLAQNLTESMVLGLTGGALGVLLSVWGVKLVLMILDETMPEGSSPSVASMFSFGIDWRVVAFTLGVSILATMVFGLSPAREALRIDLVRSLKAGGDATIAGGRHQRGARRQVALELALALMLVISTSVFVQQARREASADLGFQRNRILSVEFPHLDRSRYPSDQATMRFTGAVAAELARSPVVAAAATRASFDRLVVDDASVRADSAAARAEGHPFVSDAQLMLPSEPQRRLSRVATNADPEVVSRSYRQVIGQTLLHGRWFDASDDARERPVAVLNARLAHALWSDADPVGKTIRLGARGSVITIIGVASDVKTLTVDEQSPGALPVVYLNDMQAMGWSDEVFVRTITGASTHKGIFAPAVRAIDPERPAPTPSLLEDESTDIATTLRPESRLLGGFAIVAFALALIGIYGVTAYAVAQRTREVGIRVALGARASDVVLGMMRDGTRYVIVGLGIGVTLALGVSRVVESQLEGVAAFDPAVYLLATIGCGAVALLACYIPSRRAARVDPIGALRSE